MHLLQPSKFYVNDLSWQILETQNLGCYKTIPIKGNLAFEIQRRSEITWGNMLRALLSGPM
jgi:hypothetical protein